MALFLLYQGFAALKHFKYQKSQPRKQGWLFCLRPGVGLAYDHFGVTEMPVASFHCTDRFKASATFVVRGR